MKPTLLPTNFLMSAIGTFIGSLAEVEQSRIKLRSLEVQLSHDRAMYSMKTDFMRDLIHALIDRRIDAVQQGFRETLSLYAEQCRHYMKQHEKYADAHIKAATPFEGANLRDRLNEIDIQLKSIRSEAKLVYDEMLRAILLIGGSMPHLSQLDQRALAITI